LLSPMVGNQWHYHSATNIAAAPGQYAIGHAQRHINHHTQLYGLLGDPIAKSIGDQFHHAFFAKHQINAVYVKWQITKPQLPQAMAALGTLPTHGLSITTPLKHQCLSHADHVAPCAKRMRSCNTLARSEKKWWAYNTDGLAAVALLQPWVQPRQQPMRSCHILGAGSTAISIAAACLQQGWPVSLYARHVPTNTLASLSIQSLQSCKHLPDNAMVINTIPSQTVNFPTYLGQHLKKSMLFLDCVYQPAASPLGDIASQLGCHTIHGKQLFIQQALLQQQHWQQHRQQHEMQLNSS
jgi:3-dehydroquinate dehydratase / shikimate dehydrogenase